MNNKEFASLIIDWLDTGEFSTNKDIGEAIGLVLKQEGYVNRGTIYRIYFFDKDEIDIKKDIKQQILNNSSKQLVSFCVSISGIQYFLRHYSKYSDYSVIIKQKSDFLELYRWVNEHEDDFDENAILVELGNSDEVLAKESEDFTIVKVINNNLNEEIKLDINKGDTILTGKWRNKKVVVKDIGEDENGLPTVNGKGILKIRIQKLMKNLKEQALIKLIEKYSGKKVVLEKMLPPTSEAINNIRKIYAKDEELPQRIASVIKNWYSGSFMGQKLPANINSKMLEVFNTLKALYGNGNVSKVYRALKLKVPPTATAEKIRTMVAIKTGIAMIQSWSTERSGAEWYFKHFASEQNHSDRQKHGWAWVLVEAQVGEELELLTTANVMNQYLSDCSLGLKQGVIDFVEPEFMEMAAEHYNSDDMLKQHEVICKASNKVKVKVLDVMVKPLPPDEEEEDYTIEDLLSMLQRR